MYTHTHTTTKGHVSHSSACPACPCRHAQAGAVPNMCVHDVIAPRHAHAYIHPGVKHGNVKINVFEAYTRPCVSLLGVLSMHIQTYKSILIFKFSHIRSCTRSHTSTHNSTHTCTRSRTSHPCTQWKNVSEYG